MTTTDTHQDSAGKRHGEAAGARFEGFGCPTPPVAVIASGGPIFPSRSPVSAGADLAGNGNRHHAVQVERLGGHADTEGEAVADALGMRREGA